MDFSPIEQLSKDHLVLSHAKSSILDEWTSQQQCALILERHHINATWFKTQYASAVFDYFMGVVEGKAELGQCPVMKEFIDYLKNQEIRSDELFLLCSHFKRSVVNATYRLGIDSQPLFEGISFLFDTNFSTVLALYNDTIYQKEQEAIEANKAKEYFLSNMSHEIRTPLNAILGFVNLLKSEDLGERILKYLDIIDQSGENLLHIINDILDFSKLRSGKFVIEPQPFNIHSEITNALELFVPSAQIKSITIDYQVSPKMPQCIIADSFRIQQILGNLLSNAIKFSPPHRSIEVNVECNDSKSLLSIRVRDYGVGIEKSEQERIFNPFYQVSEGSKSSGGSGLGLSICKQLAVQMGGELTLESSFGWGSLFVVTLPIMVADEEICEVKVSMDNDTFFAGSILVAEDNEANQELIKMALERYGLHVTLVDNGEKAYQEAISNRYDLILMDEQMPIMNGHEAVAKIRLEEGINGIPHLPIVALSANVIKGSRERALQQGYDLFMGKPFNLRELEMILKRFLHKAKELKEIVIPDKIIVSTELERLQNTLQLTSEQVITLLSLFHQNMDKMMEEMNGAIKRYDCSSIAKIAHTMKGSSANFRFELFAQVSSLLEAKANAQESKKQLEEQFDTLTSEYKKLVKADDLH